MTEIATCLLDRVDQALTSNPHLFGRKLDCETNSGVVVLTGEVKSFFQKQMAQEAVRRVDGVQVVDNQLQVNWSSTSSA